MNDRRRITHGKNGELIGLIPVMIAAYRSKIDFAHNEPPPLTVDGGRCDSNPENTFVLNLTYRLTSDFMSPR